MSTTKNPAWQPRLTIAVDNLDITNGPGKRVIRQGEGVYSSDEGVEVRFTVTTPASTCPTVLRAKVYDTYNMPTKETEYSIDPVLSDDFRFVCLIGGWEFYGQYNAVTRTGTLLADYWDPYDPSDHRNQP